MDLRPAHIADGDSGFTFRDSRRAGPALGIAPVRGYYCPESGHIRFLHNNVSTKATVRTFTGSVSQDASGAMHLAGTFNVLNAAFGDCGEYPFSANE